MNKIKNLYIHIPFCRRKCSFCDFSIFAIGDSNPNDHFDDEISINYTNILIEEINFIGKHYNNHFEFINSIYFGGGTPTLLQTNLMEKIFECLRRNFKFDSDKTEISIESDPNTFDIKKLNLYHELGFNRITMGIQSLDPKVFTHLNRSHTINEGLESIDKISSSQFKDNFGVDLIQGLPSQNLESVLKDLNLLAGFYNIPHLSVYMLSLEKNSSLYKKYYKEYNTDKKNNEIADMFINTHNLLVGQLNYEHYEISNFCKSKKYSIHNKSYWDGFSNFYGFGNSASSFAFGRRFKKPNSIIKYYQFVSNLSQINFFENYLNFYNESEEFVDLDNNKELVELKYLLLNQIRRQEGINLSEIKNNFENGEKFYKNLKKYFYEKKNIINLNFEENNYCEYVSLRYPDGILISDEILIEIYNLLSKI